MPVNFEAYADRVTARLAVDPELRLDVRRELLTHLSAARREHEAAGDADPTAASAASLGEPDALADQLWQAHRRRIRQRTWTRRAMLLLPVAIVLVVLLLAWGGLRSVAPIVTLGFDRYARSADSGPSTLVSPPPSIQLTRHLTDAHLAGLPPERRLLLPRHLAPNQYDPAEEAQDAATLAALRQRTRQSPPMRLLRRSP